MVGVAIIEPVHSRLVLSDGWDISKIETTFEKAEFVGAQLYTLRAEYKVQDIFVETALKRFMPGRSRADTIVKLAKFNGITSWLCYECYGITPTYINVNTARSLYGGRGSGKGTSAGAPSPGRGTGLWSLSPR